MAIRIRFGTEMSCNVVVKGQRTYSWQVRAGADPPGSYGRRETHLGQHVPLVSVPAVLWHASSYPDGQRPGE